VFSTHLTSPRYDIFISSILGNSSETGVKPGYACWAKATQSPLIERGHRKLDGGNDLEIHFRNHTNAAADDPMAVGDTGEGQVPLVSTQEERKPDERCGTI
jgi:hypothetical protein